MTRQISSEFELLLSGYENARQREPFGRGNEVWEICVRLQRLFEASKPVSDRPTQRVKWSVGQGNWAKVPWIAFLDKRETNTTREGVYCVYLFRQDMTGVYLTFNQGVTRPKEEYGAAKGRNFVHERAAEIRTLSTDLQTSGFQLDDGIDLRAEPGLGQDYEHSTIAYKFYDANCIPDDEVLLQDLDRLLSAYDTHLGRSQELVRREVPESIASDPFVLSTAVEVLISYIQSRGFVYEPWQVAAFVTAVRTKPFVILAGITGTGKSKLPAIVAEATGAQCRIIPVRPDWTG